MIKETWKYSQIASGGNLFLTVHVTQEIQLVYIFLISQFRRSGGFRHLICWKRKILRAEYPCVITEELRS
ncbi:unnamed protein product [Larinioides sclopetarius]|uniref:Uncharacterized protein n=1 Tax=Larinioides sclopetarius TaxID=280406 RepID=A0AAV2BLR6_9ARAC